MNLLYEGIQHMIEFVYGMCGDYGIAIVLITISIRLCILPLTLRQRQEMRKQEKISLQVEKVKKKYKNRPVQMNMELEKLYQKEGTGSLGCLLSLLQFPIMLALYHGIRQASAVNITTILLPWVPSLMVRDSTYILPFFTVLVQMFPQILPYVGFLKKLHLKKMSMPMIFILLFTNSCFAFMLPAGIELYYMASGLFTSLEQATIYIIEANKVETV